MIGENEIILRIEPIANGFLVTGSKGIGDYSVARLPTNYVQSRAEIIAGLSALFEAADSLTEADVKECF